MSIETSKQKMIDAVTEYLNVTGVSTEEIDPSFIVKMVSSAIVGFYKYGKVKDAYPVQFNAMDDIKVRLNLYRQTGDRNYLVDVANFAMIESMCPMIGTSDWRHNGSAESPGRTSNRNGHLTNDTNKNHRLFAYGV